MTSSSVGRERALEVLMDQDPWGSYYRASRLVEEALPQAWAARPNLVTRNALIDQVLGYDWTRKHWRRNLVRQLKPVSREGVQRHASAYVAPATTLPALDPLLKDISSNISDIQSNVPAALQDPKCAVSLLWALFLLPADTRLPVAALLSSYPAPESPLKAVWLDYFAQVCDQQLEEEDERAVDEVDVDDLKQAVEQIVSSIAAAESMSSSSSSSSSSSNSSVVSQQGNDALLQGLGDAGQEADLESLVSDDDDDDSDEDDDAGAGEEQPRTSDIDEYVNDEDSDEAMLREALALSTQEGTENTASIEPGEVEDDGPYVLAKEESQDQNNPAPPSDYPYAAENCFDPRYPQEFGPVPALEAFWHLLFHLIHSEETVKEPREGANDEPKKCYSMGASLFKSEKSEDSNDTVDPDDDESMSLDVWHMVAALFVRLYERRAVVLASEPTEATEDALADALEQKGMSRKAADVRQENWTRQVTQWKESVRLHSQGCVFLLRWLRESMPTNEIIHPAIATALRDTLDQPLTALIVSSTPVAAADCQDISAPAEEDWEDCVLLVELYREALKTWSECISLLYPTGSELLFLLKELLSRPPSSDGSKWNDTDALPSTKSDIVSHKLHTLCNRLRTQEMIDILVAKPRSHSMEAIELLAKSSRSFRALDMLNGLAEEVKGQHYGNESVLKLYLAVGQVYHSRVVMMDGLSWTDTSSLTNMEDLVESSRISTSTLAADVSIRLKSGEGEFAVDPSQCADSIALVAGTRGVSIHQRASKSWGAALASRSFAPKTGIHRWAVRLDKCERGHVFLGVATAKGSTRTYVGGDKYGWGMIGTQALWHDRRKLRGDYGATLRSGATVIVTLDTDAGTLRFGLFKETNPLSSDLQGQTSNSSNQSNGLHTGSLEDWGVAFEGLPLDSKLYPAIGLYQRDDRVTFLSVVESAARSTTYCESSNVNIADCFFPALQSRSSTETSLPMTVRKFNLELNTEGINYALSQLQSFQSEMESCVSFSDPPLLSSLAASLCLIPSSVPVLSCRIALILLPQVHSCIAAIDKFIRRKEGSRAPTVGEGIREGQWTVRATGGATEAKGESEEYLVDVTVDRSIKSSGCVFSGSGVGTSGKSKNGLVTMNGVVNGTHGVFVEEWSDGIDEGSSSKQRDASSSCLVNVRMSLDGRSFEGKYRNVHFGTVGGIAGTLKSAAKQSVVSGSFQSVLKIRTLLCLAHSHLVSLVDSSPSQPLVEDNSKSFSRGMKLSQTTYIGHCYVAEDKRSLISGFFDIFDIPEERQIVLSEMLADLPSEHRARAASRNITELLHLVREADVHYSSVTGGKGSLRVLHPEAFDDARFNVIATMIYACDKVEEFQQRDVAANGGDAGSTFCMIWKKALTAIEGRLRSSLALEQSSSVSRRDTTTSECAKINEISVSIRSLERDVRDMSDREILDDLTFLFSTSNGEDDFAVIKEILKKASRKVFRRFCSLYIAMKEMKWALEADARIIELEASLLCLPRLLGRDQRSESDPMRKPCDEICLRLCGSGMSGACVSICHPLRSMCHEVRSALCHMMRRQMDAVELHNHDMDPAQVSILLSALPLFATAFEPRELKSLISDENVLACFSRIHEFCISRIKACCENQSSDESVDRLVQRDSYLSIAKATLFCCHVIAYSSSTCPLPSMDCDQEKTRTLEFLFQTLSSQIPLYEECEEVVKKSHSESRLELDTKLWTEQDPEEIKDISGTSRFKFSGLSAIEFLSLHGVAMRSGLKTETLKTPFVGIQYLYGLYSEDFSHWLHILSALLRDSDVVLQLASNSAWLAHLFEIIGLNVQFNSHKTIVTEYSVRSVANRTRVGERFRGRVLRMLRTVLQSYSASMCLAQGLLDLAGCTSSLMPTSSGFEEHPVSVECVSLLRHLFSVNVEWRESISSAVASSLSSSRFNSQGSCRLGVLHFVAGYLNGMRRGAYVVMRPSAASALTSEGGSTGKSQGSGGMSNSASVCGVSPHHVLGNGTDAIVGGLGSGDGVAGIVSSTDPKNGLCEVILLPRAQQQIASGSNGSSFLSKTSAGTAANKRGRHALTVRALRSQLSETYPVQELPLVLDQHDDALTFEPFFVNIFPESVARLKEQIQDPSGVNDDECNEHRDFCSIAADVLVLKACVMLSSHKQILNRVLSLPESRRSLSQTLSLGWPADAIESIARSRYQQLSTIALQLSRLEFLIRMKYDVSHRLQLFEDRPLHGVPDKVTKTEDESDEKPVLQQTTKDTEHADTSHKDAEKTSSEASVDHSHENEPRRGISRTSTGASQSDEDDEADDDDDEDEEAATAAQHLREAAIAQMAELGLPRSWSELALRRVGHLNIEAAVTFCLECGGEMERLLAEERERHSGSDPNSRNRDAAPSEQLLQNLMEMGFPRRWCMEALTVTGNNVDEALNWILNNSDRLRVEDEALGDADDADDDDDDEESADDAEDESLGESGESTHDTTKKTLNHVWSGSATPIRFISGRSIIDSSRLNISGLPSGGFSSVGTKGVLLTEGKWYYEAVLESAGCLQIGWADNSFSGHCHADKGDGCGDGPSSWAYDGWRRYKWHATATEWGCRWKEGDIVGCLVDLDSREVAFTLNGRGESIGMGVAFTGEGFRPCSGVYACVSFNRREKLRLILGGGSSEPFRYLPSGYRGVGEAVLECVTERRELLKKEAVLKRDAPDDSPSQPFLCDFSDGEHGHELMAWSHRYYGTDASVHLGSGGSKHSTSSRGAAGDASRSPSRSVSRLLQKTFSSVKGSRPNAWDEVSTQTSMLKGYNEVKASVSSSIIIDSLTAAALLSRRLVLSILVTTGASFDPTSVVEDPMIGTIDAMRYLWNIIEASASLNSVGWAGEAGAMALAAETMGLGISSNESLQQKTSGNLVGIVPVPDIDAGLSLAVPGCFQLFNSVILDSEFRSGALSGIEASLFCGSGGGSTTMLRDGLMSAVLNSDELRLVMIASVRRSVRLVSTIEYDGSDSADDKDDQSTPQPPKKCRRFGGHESPDARLCTFLTGLLLTASESRNFEDNTVEQLSEAWSVGLLSASVPWRMLCSFTLSGLLRSKPCALAAVVSGSKMISRACSRLPSVVTRRMWAERASAPICSRYSQSLTELVSAINAAMSFAPSEFFKKWNTIQVDASMPIPLDSQLSGNNAADWISEEGWASDSRKWNIWTGSVRYDAVDWSQPTRSSVPPLMDGGDGPPLLDEGCFVVRGIDWGKPGSGAAEPNEDGKDMYDEEKRKRLEEKRQMKEEASHVAASVPNPVEDGHSPDDPAESEHEVVSEPIGDDSRVATKKKKLPSPKLAIGTVIGVVPWNGCEGLGRRVRWHLTGIESTYRYGGDGGRFDLCHVETNKKRTKIKKRHPLPESKEQCAVRHGFGRKHSLTVLLRHRFVEAQSQSLGILEWPDFGAGVLVLCKQDTERQQVTVEEKQLLFGSKDAGWEVRFGSPSFRPGTLFTLDKVASGNTLFEDWVGDNEYHVEALRNPGTDDVPILKSHIKMTCGTERNGSLPPPLQFDPNCHASSLSLSQDQHTVSCASAEGRATAFGSVGFTKGVHYWEVKLEQADVGSVFIGVAEKPNGTGAGSSFSSISPPRLNRWHGWGFVNFRATYTSEAERVYGAHCHSKDTVGVLLDCDAGRLSYFFDGLKYGEHILNDLGCAFEYLSPFGFNVDGCGNGGAGQGAPNGFEGGRVGRYPSQGYVRPKTLYPVVGLRSQGDRVSFSCKWSSSYGVDSLNELKNVLRTDAFLNSLQRSCTPHWLAKEAYAEYSSWTRSRVALVQSRESGSFHLASHGLTLSMDTTVLACAAASARLGLDRAYLPGDRVHLLRSAGRVLELSEEAVVVGVYNGRLYYTIVSQKSEGGSLSEGGGRAWCLDESEVVDGLPIIGEGRGKDVVLPTLSRFRCLSSLRVVHPDGAILRSDIEIIDGSTIMATIPKESVLERNAVHQRRVNSCGVVRYLVSYKAYRGWISERIRGGSEEAIVEHTESDSQVQSDETVVLSPQEAASLWYSKWINAGGRDSERHAGVEIDSLMSFQKVLEEGVIQSLGSVKTDELLSSALGLISNYSATGDTLGCNFDVVASALCSVADPGDFRPLQSVDPACDQALRGIFACAQGHLPSLQPLLARLAILRVLNRRLSYALPWLSLRPCQEGSALFGGVVGFGSPVARVGRSRVVDDQERWTQVPTTGSVIRKLRKIIFSSVKRSFVDRILSASTTPTPLGADEYDLPGVIRTVRINRLKASRAFLSEDRNAKKKHSVFSQLQSETKSWGGAAFRRGYVAKAHGGQKRAFKVKLIGEGVNDYSGPYREVFTDALREIITTEGNGEGSLGVLDPTPNNSSGIGEGRDLFMFSFNGRSLNNQTVELPEELKSIQKVFGFLAMQRDEGSREVEDSLVFLGRVVGTAYRHGISVDLPLPLHSFWKVLTEEPATAEEELREIDLLAFKTVAEAECSSLLQWQQRMINSFAEGLSSVVPIEILPLFTGEELCEAICGNPDVDVDLLRRVVEYEGYQETDRVIGFFWNTLREMTRAERQKFLQFVWARNRLPSREADFEAPFKILKDTATHMNQQVDQVLPSASTCFFSLTLPDYSSQEILKQKLLFAISNVTTMETDFHTNNAEIAEGYRAF